MADFRSLFGSRAIPGRRAYDRRKPDVALWNNWIFLHQGCMTASWFWDLPEVIIEVGKVSNGKGYGNYLQIILIFIPFFCK